jgi:branched-chain amino acid transport system permease protein
MKKSDSMLAANIPLLIAMVLLFPAGYLVQDSGLLDSYIVRIIMLCGITITAAVSLQLINGISGQFSLGHAGFMAIGAYTAAWISLRNPAYVVGPFALPAHLLCLLIGGIAAGIAGLIVGIPTLRLRGDYLAIATLGFAEIVRVLLQSSETLGRALGLTKIPKLSSFYSVYGLAIIATFAVWRIVHSARGRAMLAVREDEIAAASLGISPARSKVMAFVFGAFFAGTAGAVLAQYEGYIAPGNFNFMRSVELVVIVTLAGAGSITGTILLAVILGVLPQILDVFNEYRMIIYSLVLIVTMLARPAGILGNRELIPRRKLEVEKAPA